MSYTNISVIPPQWYYNHSARLRPVDWDNITDEGGHEIWNRLTSDFWLPGKVPLSNDLPSWNQLSDVERSVTTRAFVGLTTLDAVQVTVGEISQIRDDITEHEQTIYTNIVFMQAVHARSCSSVFSTLSNAPKIGAVYIWAVNNDLLQERAKIILQHYYDEDSLKHKVASTLLSSLLLYTGFCLPPYFSAREILMNAIDMVHLILRNKVVHGYYSGCKHQRGSDLHPGRMAEMEGFTFQLLDDLCELELEYSGGIYESTGLMDDVAVFACYSTNEAMTNLGYPTRFAPEGAEVKTDVLAALASGSEEAHDFFSGSGSFYTIGSAKSTSDEDWDL